MLGPTYNPFLVYCRELAPGTVSLTGDRAQGGDSKHDLHYTYPNFFEHQTGTTHIFHLGLSKTGKLNILKL